MQSSVNKFYFDTEAEQSVTNWRPAKNSIIFSLSASCNLSYKSKHYSDDYNGNIDVRNYTGKSQ
jgi:hypothetical protein